MPSRMRAQTRTEMEKTDRTASGYSSKGGQRKKGREKKKKKKSPGCRARQKADLRWASVGCEGKKKKRKETRLPIGQTDRHAEDRSISGIPIPPAMPLSRSLSRCSVGSAKLSCSRHFDIGRQATSNCTCIQRLAIGQSISAARELCVMHAYAQNRRASV